MIMKSFEYKGKTFYHGQRVLLDYHKDDKVNTIEGTVYINDKDENTQQMFVFNNYLAGTSPAEKHDRGEFKYSWWVSTEPHRYSDNKHEYDRMILNIRSLTIDNYEII